MDAAPTFRGNDKQSKSSRKRASPNIVFRTIKRVRIYYGTGAGISLPELSIREERASQCVSEKLLRSPSPIGDLAPKDKPTTPQSSPSKKPVPSITALNAFKQPQSIFSSPNSTKAKTPLESRILPQKRNSPPLDASQSPTVTLNVRQSTYSCPDFDSSIGSADAKLDNLAGSNTNAAAGALKSVKDSIHESTRSNILSDSSNALLGDLSQQQRRLGFDNQEDKIFDSDSLSRQTVPTGIQAIGNQKKWRTNSGVSNSGQMSLSLLTAAGALRFNRANPSLMPNAKIMITAFKFEFQPSVAFSHVDTAEIKSASTLHKQILKEFRDSQAKLETIKSKLLLHGE